ncbi:MAG: MFS transporter [Deltaproteobacteria bacterium]|nr:MFS transporter [Deltaproteobacteria bacterium]
MRPDRIARVAFLAALYLVQGLPFGFQANALSALLRDEGVSMTHITLTTALALPWSLKALWAPFVDRHHWSLLGRRRSWILPMQALLALSMIGAAFAPIRPDPWPLLALVLVMNLFAATMDIAVDGLAVDLLAEGELGAGNAAQVVGYKVGMLAGGGLLVWASERFGLGWSGLFLAMSAVVGVVLVITLFVDERRLAHTGPSAEAPAHVSVRAILGTLREAMAKPSARWLVLLLVTYKLGESLVDPVFLPLLVDQGIERATIGLWVGTYGMAASIAGSLLGGVLASRLSVARAFPIVGSLRVLALSMPWAIALLGVRPIGALPGAFVIASTCAEHLVSGALTTLMFAFMMQHTDRRIGATHYTLLATLEVLGKAPLAMASGWIADTMGAGVSFGIAVALAAGWVVLFTRTRERLSIAT